ncbi:hypothetical protein Golomagni_06792, partial [Golovinomyces magnicellulatus]
MTFISITRALAFVAIILVLRVFQLSRRIQRSSISQLPGPWYSKYTGIVLDIYCVLGKRSFYVHDLHKKYGPVVRIAPNDVDITDAEAIRTIYSVKETFTKTAFYNGLVGPGQESMFSTLNVDFHRRHRKLLAQPMSETSLKTFIPAIRGLSDRAVERISTEMETCGAADVHKWFMFMTADVIGQLTFGESFHMLELGKPNEYIRELKRVGRVGVLRSTFPNLTRMAYKLPVKLPIFTEAVEAGRNMRRFAHDSLNRYRRLVEEEPGKVKQTLFTNVFKAEENETLPFHEVETEAHSYIVGGADTTANSLTYLVWAVCRQPSIRDKLVEELQTLPEDYYESDLRTLPFLNCVIQETLRLYSALPSALPRTVPREGSELAGYWLDAGTTVSAQAYSMHRNPEIFPNPDEFTPDRWL